MLDAIALYLRYQSSHIISLRIVITDLNLLSCISRKDKTDIDLIRNAVLFWNNVVSCAIFKCKRVQFRFLLQHVVFFAVLRSIYDLFFLSELTLWFVTQITVWVDDFFFFWWTLVSSLILICVNAKNFDFRFLSYDAVICEVIELNKDSFWSYNCAL